ncbi:MAG TPA: CCA tRNA nucleotidyltransferase [Stellaceae bacterium]|nr:CCA tRNA nucleotidyltransferase [Stellaceae bacterium]
MARIAARLKPQAWMREASCRAVMKALTSKGGAARFVGGVVRDALLQRAIKDIDIATPLLPAEVMKRLKQAKLKAVPTGLEHGTVTAVAGKRHYEITTLRRDVKTYGRHAEVEFAADWAEDAVRRDFTMNALFLDADGKVFDYVGGLPDLEAGRVRFVGDPATRIREDVLRLLRFYRFFAHYGKTAPDGPARLACRTLAYLLPNLSGERIRNETLRLLAAPDPLPALQFMQEDGVLSAFLPEASGLERLRNLVALESKPDALRRLAALIERDADLVAARLKLSSAQRARLIDLTAEPPLDLAAGTQAQRRALHHLDREPYIDRALLAAARTGDGARLKPLLALAKKWKPVEFPLKGRDLTRLGIKPGPELGKLLGALAAWWEAGDFAAKRKDCLAEAKRRIGKRG